MRNILSTYKDVVEPLTNRKKRHDFEKEVVYLQKGKLESGNGNNTRSILLFDS